MYASTSTGTSNLDNDKHTEKKTHTVNSRNQVRPRRYKRIKFTKGHSKPVETSEHTVDNSVQKNESCLFSDERQTEAFVSSHNRLLQGNCNDGKNLEDINFQLNNMGNTASVTEFPTDVDDDAINSRNINLTDEDGIINRSFIEDSVSDSEQDYEDLIDIVKHQEDPLVDTLLFDLRKQNNWENEDSDTDSENENGYCESLNQPLSPGHLLTLKTSVLMVWMYAICHCLTASQLGDLLTLINLHLMALHPVYSSLHRFKNVLSKDIAAESLKRHFYCGKCFHPCNENHEVCENELCRKQLDKNCRAHFVELNILAQLRNLFKREDFKTGLDYRLQRNKQSSENIEDVYDGLSYKKLMLDFDQSATNLTFTFNTDGVPIFKSSKTSIWPVFLMINELPFKMRANRDFMILAGLWCGQSKPDMNLFLTPLIKSFIALEKGVEINNKHVVGHLLCMSCDLPARSAVLNMNNHNGDSSCIKCLQTGTNFRTANKGNVRVFPYVQDNPNGPPRTHTDLINDSYKALTDKSKHVRGIKGPSMLMLCPKYDCIKGTAVDYMHMLCLGLVRLLLNLWFNVSNSSQVFSVYSDVKIVDDRLENIKVPYFIKRKPRSISDNLKFWKAAELRSWFYYYSVPCLTGILQPRYLYHYCAFLQAMFLLNQSSISQSDILKSEALLRYFVFLLPTLYGEKCLTLNAHSLLHLPECVKELGPLWSYSCFSFEGANGELLKMFHGTQFIDIQIANAVHIYQLLPTLADSVSSSNVAYKFIKSLTNTVSVNNESDKANVFMLGKPYQRQLPLSVGLEVRKLVGCENVQLNFYNRAKIKGNLYHSMAYSRVTKRNSYSVKFLLNGNICFGFIHWFATFRNNSVDYSMACVEKFEIKNWNVFEQCDAIDDEDELIRQNFMNVNLPHIKLLKQCGKMLVISVEDICNLCICANFDDVYYFCEEPNMHEKSL
ncbi:uncharacterized protein LOC128551126 [Mercenaria mercenaria]|uniref:uncharacterized protein LOC128551126 n=1 Tax=Mercenaria mercenaria TaxID=6596 RepID=UPI00234EE91F|nr:uncharacterized protein LOC128551126 [Mercenaria mercenaria]XP_053387540.1 uncharacterized protein LOC128551126 [Mercenaria mercenaria]